MTKCPECHRFTFTKLVKHRQRHYPIIIPNSLNCLTCGMSAIDFCHELRRTQILEQRIQFRQIVTQRRGGRLAVGRDLVAIDTVARGLVCSGAWLLLVVMVVVVGDLGNDRGGAVLRFHVRLLVDGLERDGRK